MDFDLFVTRVVIRRAAVPNAGLDEYARRRKQFRAELGNRVAETACVDAEDQASPDILPWLTLSRIWSQLV